MKLVFATHNEHKLNEVQRMLPKEITLLTLDEIGCFEDIPETSNTIEGNAIQKALYIKEKYGYDTFADDTGLEVVALDNAPGVYSARYAGEAKDNEANIDLLLANMKGKQERIYIPLKELFVEKSHTNARERAVLVMMLYSYQRVMRTLLLRCLLIRRIVLATEGVLCRNSVHS